MVIPVREPLLHEPPTTGDDTWVLPGRKSENGEYTLATDSIAAIKRAPSPHSRRRETPACRSPRRSTQHADQHGARTLVDYRAGHEQHSRTALTPGHGHDIRLGTGAGSHHLADEKNTQCRYASLVTGAEPGKKGLARIKSAAAMQIPCTEVHDAAEVMRSCIVALSLRA